MIRLGYTYGSIEIQTYVDGAAANATSVTAACWREGSLEAGVAVTVGAGTNGRYLGSFTTLTAVAGWSADDHVVVIASALINGVTYTTVVFDSRWISGDASVGTGARTVVITVDDGTDPIEAARVRVTQGTQTIVQSTDSNGEATFNLDDATWTVAITRSGYSFAGASLVVNGDETATYSMTLLIVLPGDPTETTGYLTVLTNAGVPAPGVVVQLQIMKLANGTTGSGIDDPLAEETSDVNGLVEFPGLPRLAKYRVRIGTDGKWFDGVTLDADTTPLAGALGLPE